MATKTTAKKVTKSYTTTSGVKVTKYSDGTEKRTGGSSSSSSNTPQTREQQISAIKAQGDKIKSTYDSIKGTLTQPQIDSLSGSVSKASAALTKAGAPTNAGAINTAIAPYVAPGLTPPMGDITGPTASIAGMQAYNEAEKQRQLKVEQQRQADQAKTQKSFIESLVSPSDARKNAQEETGIDVGDYFAKQEKGIKEIETLSESYNAVVAARDQQIAQSNDKMASMNFINNQTAQIERNAAPKLNEISANINAKTATLEAQQGNFAQAQTYVNQAVQDATADNKFKYDMYATMYQENKDNFDRIDSIYSTSFKNAMDLAKVEYEEQLAEKQTIGELILTYNADGAGITMKDSLDEAFRKAGITNTQARRLNEAQIANEWSNASGGAGGGAVSSTPTGEGGDLAKMFNIVVGSAGSVTESKRLIALFNGYMAEGDTESAQQLVNTLAVKNMSAEQRNRFVSYGNISAAIDGVMKNAEAFAATNPGLYKTLFESAKPFASASTDPVWQKFVAETQNSINVYRNEIFGASLTGNELASSNISLPNWNKDTAGTIFNKLAAMQSFANNTREGTIRSTTGQYSSSALGQEPTPQNIIETTSAYDEATGQQSEGGWFSKFINWFR